MSAAETIKKAQVLRKEQRYRDAFEAAQQATQLDPKSADAWWQLGLNANSIEDRSNALVGFRETVRLAPRFASGWAQFGQVLSSAGKIDEAEKAFLQAVRIEPAEVYHLRLLASFYGEKKDPDGQLRILLKIDELGNATSDELNRIGIHYYNKKIFGEALSYYRRSAATTSGTAALFNLGLVYNDTEVSQDADAVDAWRRALAIDKAFERASERLAAVTPRLAALAKEAFQPATLLSGEEWFQHYLNPFELLGVDEATEFHELDAKTLQRMKKSLLQEITLENGRVSWLGGLVVDQSRAIGLCDELTDETKKIHHWHVFNETELLRFLTRGEHKHFLFDQQRSPLDTLEFLDTSPEFRAWISEPFARQYNQVLSRAIERGALPIIEALFDGRRWVLPEHDDLCFDGAFRHADRLLKPLRVAADAAAENPPVLGVLDAILIRDQFLSIFNLLPAHFRVMQSEAVQLVRTIAIACHNQHGDSDLSKAVLQLSKRFVFKSADLTHQLLEDSKKIEELIREQRKHEAKLTSGSVAWEVTKDGVRQGQRFIATDTVSSIRWGILVTGYQSAPTYEYLMAFRDDARTEVIFTWKTSVKLEENGRLFNNLVQAALVYIAPTILGKISSRLERGDEITIGTCRLRKDGVVFSTQGWIFSKTHVVPWAQVGTKLQKGDLIVFDNASQSTRTVMPLRETENAIMLQLLSKARD